MEPRYRTLTTIGLPARTELLIKSMLLGAGGTTTDQWAFSEEVTSDVAICDPDSSLSAVARSRAAHTGRPRCVWLVGEFAGGRLDGPTLRDPIGSAGLIAVLESLSIELASAEATPPAVGARAVPVIADVFNLGLALRRLMASGSRQVHRVDTEGAALYVFPASRTLRPTVPLGDHAIARLLSAPIDAPMAAVSEDEALRLTTNAGTSLPVDRLLWRGGIDGPHDRLLPGLPSDAAFRLRRWPDFGRVGHDPAHLRMAAVLTRTPHGLEDLAQAVSAPIAKVLPFINACGLCDLVDLHAAGTTSPFKGLTPEAMGGSEKAGYGSILRTIRSALGLGR
jgi:hypothetical protein